MKTYTLSYTEDTNFSPGLGEKVILEKFVFTEQSKETNLDLPVFILEGEFDKYILNYTLTLAKDVSTGILYHITEDHQQTLATHKMLLDTIIFGEIIPWSEANELFPALGKALIKDLETGIYFKVQRRGGSSHIDSQPLTLLDTDMMKNAYSGNWSWDRRAIIVKSGDRFIAASMNGMPHGAGAIQDNGFDGHSCIHFLESTTHGSNNLDFAHQLMVKKAGGHFFETLMSMPPEDILKAFFILSTQKQVHHLQYIMKDVEDDITLFSRMQSVTLGSITKLVEEVDYAMLEVEALYYIENQRYEEMLVFEFEKKPWHLTWKLKFIE